jgi:transposase-like protein
MSERGRRRFSPQRKADLLKQHLLEKKDVSKVCDEADLQPSQLYKWQRELLDAAPEVFSTRRAPNREQELEQRIAALESKLSKKDVVIAEISEEYVKLKKELGES